MDWKVIIIGLIPLAVFILSTIFRSVEEARDNRKPRTPPDFPPQPARRRPGSELDRFLQESRQRRDKPPAEKPRQVEPSPPPVATPTLWPETSSPDPTPLAPRPDKTAARPTQPAPARKQKDPPARRAQPAIVAPSRPPATVEALPQHPAPPPAPALPTALPAPPPAPVNAARPAGSPALTRVLGLLRSGDGLAAAMILHEVFEPPLSKRHHRGKQG
ncbi:MAG: hypothetical protein U0840_20430 [Gemmataceae bacterium]